MIDYFLFQIDLIHKYIPTIDALNVIIYTILISGLFLAYIMYRYKLNDFLIIIISFIYFVFIATYMITYEDKIINLVSNFLIGITKNQLIIIAIILIIIIITPLIYLLYGIYFKRKYITFQGTGEDNKDIKIQYKYYPLIGIKFFYEGKQFKIIYLGKENKNFGYKFMPINDFFSLVNWEKHSYTIINDKISMNFILDNGKVLKTIGYYIDIKNMNIEVEKANNYFF